MDIITNVNQLPLDLALAICNSEPYDVSIVMVSVLRDESSYYLSDEISKPGTTTFWLARIYYAPERLNGPRYFLVDDANEVWGAGACFQHSDIDNVPVPKIEVSSWITPYGRSRYSWESDGCYSLAQQSGQLTKKEYDAVIQAIERYVEGDNNES